MQFQLTRRFSLRKERKQRSRLGNSVAHRLPESYKTWPSVKGTAAPSFPGARHSATDNAARSAVLLRPMLVYCGSILHFGLQYRRLRQNDRPSLRLRPAAADLFGLDHRTSTRRRSVRGQIDRDRNAGRGCSDETGLLQLSGCCRPPSRRTPSMLAIKSCVSSDVWSEADPGSTATIGKAVARPRWWRLQTAVCAILL